MRELLWHLPHPLPSDTQVYLYVINVVLSGLGMCSKLLGNKYELWIFKAHNWRGLRDYERTMGRKDG